MSYTKTNHPEYYRWRKILTRYGLTKQSYDQKLLNQNNCCSLCCKKLEQTLDRNTTFHPQIDHDHKTGRVRDLLCRGCNTSLGHFEVGMKRWPSFIYYVIKHKIKHYLNIRNLR